MIKIKVATSNTRGFLKNLFDYKSEKMTFVYEKNNLYEIAPKKRNILATLIKFPVFDWLGVFQIVNAKNTGEDACFSYNRFLNTDKPYYILLENPSALVNYCWERPKHIITKLRLKKCFGNPNLKGVVCMSKTCFDYFENLYGMHKELRIYQNYPLVLEDKSYSNVQIKELVNKDVVECIYISSDFELKGGKDILTVFKKLQAENKPIHLTCITKSETISCEDKKIIEELKNVSVIEFNLSKKELDEYYKASAILLNPTRADSFSLVTLEAIKYGCTVLATNIYAIKEMVIDGYNGYIIDSMFNVWDEDGTLNKYFRRHQKKLLHQGIVDQNVVDWLYKKINELVEDRMLLEKMCNNSLILARETDFSEENVIKKWEELYEQI